METLFRNLRTIEQLKEEWKTQGISIIPCRRCMYDKVTGEKIPGKYEYLKHSDGTQKYFGVSDDQKTTCAVAKAVATDLENSGAPNPDRVVVVQEVSQDGGESWTLSLMYSSGSNEVTFRF